MREGTRGSTGKSSELLWETLEQTIRGKVQEFIQEILEEEVTDFLGGRRKSQRKSSAEGDPKGYRNGYGKPRNLTLASGTVEVRRPRVRDVEERFESRVLPLFERRTKESAELVVQLYLHGLAEGDFELALRGLLGDGAPLSKSTVRRLREKWIAEHAEWECRSLAGREIVYAWAGGIYVKAGLEKDKAALLVIIGAMADGTKEVLAVASGFRESAESWAGVLRGLRARGLGVQKRAKALLREVVYAESGAAAEAARERFEDRYGGDYPKAAETLADDWDRMTAFFDFPAAHWTHLRTTNVVESPFAAVRLRTSAAKRFKRVEGATALIWKLLMVAEKRFRKLNAPHLLPGVLRGDRYEDGQPVPEEEERRAA